MNFKIYIIGLFITIQFLSCQEIENHSRLKPLPNDSLIMDVINAVVLHDSELFALDSLFIASELCSYTMWISERGNENNPPPTPPLNIVSPIEPSNFIQFFKSKLNIEITTDDSIYFALEIDSLKNIEINKGILAGKNLAKIKYQNQQDYMRYDSILVFQVPIFTADNKYVFVKYNFQGHGYGSFMQKQNDKWIRIREVDTWTRCK
jgi:hypothetical protein